MSGRPPTGPELFDCRDAFTGALVDLARADPRIVAVVNDSVGSTQARRLPAGVPRPVRQRRHRRAEPGRHRRRPRQRRADPVRLRRLAVPDRPRARADQGRCRLLEREREARRRQLRRGLRRARADPPLDRGLAWLRAIANLSVVVPADPAETDQAVRAAHRHGGPVFMRTSRMPVPAVHEAGYRFAFGQGGSSPGRQRRDDHRQRRDGRARAGGRRPARRARASRARVLNMATVEPPRPRGDPGRSARDRRDRDGRGAHGPGRSGRGGRRARRPSSARCRCGSSASPASSRRPGRPSSCSSTSGSRPTASRAAARELVQRRPREREHGPDPGDRPGDDEHEGGGRRRGGRDRVVGLRPHAARLSAAGLGRERRGSDLGVRCRRPPSPAWRASATPAAHVASIALTNQREAVVVWERATGRPLGPCISWQCRRTADPAMTSGRGPRAAHPRPVRPRHRPAVLGDQGRLAARCDRRMAAPRRAGEICVGTVDSWVAVEPHRRPVLRDRPHQRVTHPAARSRPAALGRRAARGVRRSRPPHSPTSDRRAAGSG